VQRALHAEPHVSSAQSPPVLAIVLHVHQDRTTSLPEVVTRCTESLTDVAQGSEGHLQQGVGPFANCPDAVVGLAQLLLHDGEVIALGFPEGHGDDVGLPLPSQLTQR
jgi:hypothetical protein